MRIDSLTIKLLALLIALVFSGLVVSAYASKPGDTGSQSVASIGISLRVPSTIRARQVRVSQPDTNESTVNGDKYVCLDLNRNQRVSLYVLTYSANGSTMMPVSNWLSDGQQTGQYPTRPRNCVSVPLHLPASYQSKDGQITLIISPE